MKRKPQAIIINIYKKEKTENVIKVFCQRLLYTSEIHAGALGCHDICN